MSTGWLFGYGGDGRVTEADLRDRTAPLVVAFGGGANSVATLVGMRERDLVPDAIVFSDTGGVPHSSERPREKMGEKPETYAYLPIMDRWLDRAGFPRITVIARKPIQSGASLEEKCLTFNDLPSRVFGFSTCAVEWKIWPMEAWAKKWEPTAACLRSGRTFIKAIGYDAGEEGRAKGLEAKDHGGKPHTRLWYPLLEWSWDRRACYSAIEREGLPPPPKSACFFCPSSKPHEVVWLADTHPDLFARAIEMERRALASGNLGEVKGLGRTWS